LGWANNKGISYRDIKIEIDINNDEIWRPIWEYRKRNLKKGEGERDIIKFK